MKKNILFWKKQPILAVLICRVQFPVRLVFPDYIVGSNSTVNKEI